MKKNDAVILILSLLIAGITSILLGMDRNPDALNYGLYTPFAFLTDRIGYDFMPCCTQSYFNPLKQIPYYLGIKYFNNHPVFITFLSGFAYGIFIFLTYKLSFFILSKKNTQIGKAEKIIFVFTSTLIATTASLVVYSIGAELNGDMLIADLLLFIIYYILKNILNTNKKSLLKNYLFIGIISGATIGLKLTAAASIIPILMTILFIKRKENFLNSLLIISFSTIFGFILTHGYWSYILYKNFHNPFMPYFNNIFRSSYIINNFPYGLDYVQYYPRNALEYIFYPFLVLRIFTNIPHGFDYPIQDLRYAVLYLSIILLILMNYLKPLKFIKQKISDYFDIGQLNFLVMSTILTYLFWLNMFPNFRFLLHFCTICGIFISIVLFTLTKKSLYIVSSATVIILFLITTVTGTACTNYRINVFKIHKLYGTEKLSELKDDSIAFTLWGSTVAIENPNARFITIGSHIDQKYSINEILSKSAKASIKESVKKNKNNVYYVGYIDIWNPKSAYTAERINKILKNNYSVQFDEKSCRFVKGILPPANFTANICKVVVK